jgi:hypothetical protein
MRGNPVLDSKIDPSALGVGGLTGLRPLPPTPEKKRLPFCHFEKTLAGISMGRNQLFFNVDFYKKNLLRDDKSEKREMRGPMLRDPIIERSQN